MLMETHACNRTAESQAGRRSSGQLTVQDANPTHVCSFTLDGTPDTVFELWKRFQRTTHTELTSEQCHYSWLRQLFGCECNMLVSTLSLRHIVKMLLHLEAVTNGTRETPGVAPPQRTHHQRESSQR